MLDVDKVRKSLEKVVNDYEKSAPTVSAWADALYIRVNENADNVRLSELLLADDLASGEVGPNVSANRVYKLMHRLGQDTTGHAGY